MESKAHDGAVHETPRAKLIHEIYGAFMAECEAVGGVKEPSVNPWPSHIPFYQIMDSFAAKAAEIATKQTT